ncbi:hypothetical protein L211DRAFT_848538 [Terfezia boudieri ATCC MYA-4762]|uniref:Tc1-like transposase DDE domain-containing protein n=1 Tax=Terfezia boudieri ATCC MYA-4762 TaxID=1051890 RepID=A0A3N4LU11_9PEZI|nr:hypothetical protein L211DRAFT_848538 [Terfezia boudieri ATCC MYA-4762]
MAIRGTKRGRQPEWRFNADNGAFVRASKSGGIDWYRYLNYILLQKLLPFANVLKHSGLPNVTVMEDKAPSHASRHQQAHFDTASVQRLLWPGNSPDLNMIETCWAYLKRITTKKVTMPYLPLLCLPYLPLLCLPYLPLLCLPSC